MAFSGSDDRRIIRRSLQMRPRRAVQRAGCSSAVVRCRRTACHIFTPRCFTNILQA